MNFPDFIPPLGTTPGGNPVATVTAVVNGPARDECCKGGTFQMTLTVSSQVGAANNGTTARFLADAFCNVRNFELKANTKGIANRPQSTVNCATLPAPPPFALAAAVTVNLTSQVVIKCPGFVLLGNPLWPCSVREKKFKTTLEIAGPLPSPPGLLLPGTGAIEVHWKVDIEGGGRKGRECLTTQATAIIDNIVFFRSGFVYSPIVDRFMLPNDNPDGDAATNYEEVLDGTHPTVADNF